MKGTRLQTCVLTTRHQLPDQLQQLFQVSQHTPLEVVAAFGILGNCLHLLQRPFPLSLVDRFSQRGWPAEVAMGQQVDLPHTQTLAGKGLHEAGDFVRIHTVHAHERPQRDHV